MGSVRNLTQIQFWDETLDNRPRPLHVDKRFPVALKGLQQASEGAAYSLAGSRANDKE